MRARAGTVQKPQASDPYSRMEQAVQNDKKAGSYGGGSFNSDTFPCCLGYYGTPLPPNGPCQNCQYASVCLHVTENFVPKAKLDPIMARIERIQAILRGEK